MKSGEKALFTFILGAAAGAALGLLFAPYKGSETRDRLRKEFDHRKDQLEDMMDDLGEIIEEGKESFKEMMEEGKEKVADIKSKIHQYEKTEESV